MSPSSVGSRWVANSQGEIASLEDFARLNLRMRVQANPIEAEVWSTYGATPSTWRCPRSWRPCARASSRPSRTRRTSSTPTRCTRRPSTSPDRPLLLRRPHVMSDQAIERIPSTFSPRSRAPSRSRPAGARPRHGVPGPLDREPARRGRHHHPGRQGRLQGTLEPLYDRVADEVEANELLEAIRRL